MKKTLIAVLAVLVLAGMAAAEDTLGAIPAGGGEMDGFEESNEPSGSWTYAVQYGDAPGMDVEIWWDDDFCWTHTWPNASQPGMYVLQAQLAIRAFDVDSSGTSMYGPEVDKIYADGVYLGDLVGTNDAWSLTPFDVPPALIEDGTMEVCIDVDSTNVISSDWWATKIDKSNLAVKYDYAPPAPEAVGAVMAIALASPAFGYLLIRRRR